MTTSEFLAPLNAFWMQYGAQALIWTGVVGIFAMAFLVAQVRRSRRPLRPIALAISMNLALLLNAEGMWVVAIDRLHLPPAFAVLVFAVFEICFLTATSLAAEQYRRTTIYRPDRTIETPGHPGRMLWVAALIAALSGIIVASNAPTGTEKLLRLAVPGVIFLMWWAALTAAGQRRRRSRFAYSPRRLAERWGWLIPDEDSDLDKLRAERQVRRMVVNHQRVSAGRWPKSWWRNRLQRDARTATDGVVDAVVVQLARIDRVMALLGPARAPGIEIPCTDELIEQSPEAGVPQAQARRARTARLRRRSLRRQVCTAHPKVIVRTAREPRRDPRTAQEKAEVVRAVLAANPARKQAEIARLTDLPPSTVRDVLPRIREAGTARQVNGKKPDLEGANH